MTSKISAICAALGVATIGGLTAMKTPGDKDVNVINTPNVNVVNTPTVSVKDAREPVHFSMEHTSESVTASIPEDKQYVVPAGKRLYITHVSGVLSFPLGEKVFVHTIQAFEGITPKADHYLRLGDLGPTALPNVSSQTFSQEIDMTADAGQTVGGFWAKDSDGSGTYRLKVTGYLVDLP